MLIHPLSSLFQPKLGQTTTPTKVISTPQSPSMVVFPSNPFTRQASSSSDVSLPSRMSISSRGSTPTPPNPPHTPSPPRPSSRSASMSRPTSRPTSPPTRPSSALSHASPLHSLPGSPTLPAFNHLGSSSTTTVASGPHSQAHPSNHPHTPTPAVAHTASHDHYQVRFATSYMIKVLTPVIRSTDFTKSEGNRQVKRITDDRLAMLARMERSWGSEWAITASSLFLTDRAQDASLQAKEDKLRASLIGEGAKARERRLFVVALKDGIILCLLFNHLFPALRIASVKMYHDDTKSDVNVERFLAACTQVGLPESAMFSPLNIDETSADGLARVAFTVLALARKALLSTGVIVRARERSRVSKPPSIAPHPSSGSTSSSHRSPCLNESARHANDRHVDEPVSPVSVNAVKRTHATLQPSPGLPARSESPLNGRSTRTTPLATRLAQRTSSSTSPSLVSKVSFARDAPPRVTGIDRTPSPLHVRERTPSLISSSSRVTSSAYTRSSAAYSFMTVLGDEHTALSPEEDEDEERDYGSRDVIPACEMPQLRARRMSEKTLHEARQKIIGTLLRTNTDEFPGLPVLASVEDARGFALSQSLAALEGVRPVQRSMPIPPRSESPRLRPVPRHGHSGMECVQDRVSEEDVIDEDGLSRQPIDEEGQGPSGQIIEGSPHRPFLRRISVASSNGKFYVAKRSLSPVSPDPSSSGGAFKLLPTLAVAEESLNPTSRAERRRSEGYRSPVADAGGTESILAGSSRPVGVRNQSMVNLTTSSGRVSSISVGSRDSMVKGSVTSQVLEFTEPGQPTVRYQLGNTIGRGQFGTVYRSLNLGTGQMAAIKRIRLHGLQETEVRDVMREVELLKRLSHPSIVKYEGMSRDDNYLNIVLEFVENGSLGQTLKAFGKFNERLVCSYVAKILEGLHYLHSEGVVHCDLKAANILSTKNGNVKLSDFGVSLNMRAVESIAHDAATIGKLEAGKSNVVGTPNWMAPEVIKLAGASPASDIWSLGCTIIELLTGRPPYADVGNSMTVLFRVVDDPMPPLPESSPELADFLQSCFTKDPTKRPSAAALFQHPWVRKINPELILRPQDSMPFLRRLSQDVKRVESQLVFSAVNISRNSLTDVDTTNVDRTPATKLDAADKASDNAIHGVQTDAAAKERHMSKQAATPMVPERRRLTRGSGKSECIIA